MNLRYSNKTIIRRPKKRRSRLALLKRKRVNLILDKGFLCLGEVELLSKRFSSALQNPNPSRYEIMVLLENLKDVMQRASKFYEESLELENLGRADQAKFLRHEIKDGFQLLHFWRRDAKELLDKPINKK